MFVLRVELGMVRRDGGICCFLFFFDTLTVSMYFVTECTIHTFSQNSFQHNLSLARGNVNSRMHFDKIKDANQG